MASRVESLKAEALRGMHRVDSTVPASTMLQVAQRLALQAACFERSADLDRAFILMYRVARLLTTELPRHADFPASAAAARATAEQCVASLERLRRALDAAPSPVLPRSQSAQHAGPVAAVSLGIARSSSGPPGAATAASASAAWTIEHSETINVKGHRGPLTRAMESTLATATRSAPAHDDGDDIYDDVLPPMTLTDRSAPRPSAPAVDATLATPASNEVVYPALCRLEDAPPLLSAPAPDAPVSYPLLDLSRRMPVAAASPSAGARSHGLVTLPRAAVDAFLAAASPNTTRSPRGIETCALLAGRDGVITTVILPPQRGEADMCEMTDEVAALTTCLSRSVHVLGWIHTHPSQSCFLSSMDLHTHAGFQSSLPSAVAVVCAPRDAMQSIGVFRLTDESDVAMAGGFMRSGLDIVQTCVRTGFHPHNTTAGVDLPLYLPASHVAFDPHARVELLDMR